MEHNLGSFGNRLLALIIDSFIISVVTTILLGVFFGNDLKDIIQNPEYYESMGDNEVIAFVTSLLIKWSGYAALAFLFGWLYFAIQNSSAAQGTIGKRTLGLKVTDMEGNRISFGRASGRYFARQFISGVFFLAGYWIALFTKKQQSIHDLIASTLVLNKEQP